MGTTELEQFQSVDDFKSRLSRSTCGAPLLLARFTKFDNDFVSVNRAGPMQQEAEAKIDALLKGKQRIMPTRVSIGSTSEVLPLPDLFKEVNELVDKCLATSCEALEQVGKLGAICCRFSDEGDEYVAGMKMPDVSKTEFSGVNMDAISTRYQVEHGLKTFKALNRGDLCSIAYLRWVQIARSLSLAGQDCLGSYLKAEHAFIREFYERDLFGAPASPAPASKTDLRKEIAKLTTYLQSPETRPERKTFLSFQLIQLTAEMNAPVEVMMSTLNTKIATDAERRERDAAHNQRTKALPRPVAKALKRRPDGALTAFHGEGWYDWQQPSGYHLSPWPFPRRLNGCEDAAKLLEESARWKAFGTGLHTLPIDDLGGCASEEDWTIATKAFAVVTDAALTLIWLAHVVEACVSAQRKLYCSYCYRPVDSGSQQRKRCAKHRTRSSNRTEATKWAGVAVNFHARLSALKSTLAAEPAYLDPGPQLTAYWRTMMTSVYNRSPETTDTAWHFQSSYKACSILSWGLRRLLRGLEPIAGPVLLSELRELARLLIKKAVVSVKAREEAAAQVAVHALSPPMFFLKWLQQSGCLPVQDMAAPAPVLWISMEQVVRDLLRYRAWMEIGGGKATPVNCKKSAFCVEDAAFMRQEGRTYAAIGLHFSVSKQYVGKILQKASLQKSEPTAGCCG